MSAKHTRTTKAAVLLLGMAVTLLTGCETFGEKTKDDQTYQPRKHSPVSAVSAETPEVVSTDITAESEKSDLPKREAVVYKGTGKFVGKPKSRLRKPKAKADEGQLTLNFQNTDVREVIQTVLGDLLEENFVMDPAVSGTVSITTGRPLPRSQLLPVFEDLLLLNGIVLVQEQGLIKVLPQANAVKGKLRPSFAAPSLRPGYSVRIVPLRYTSAVQMQTLLDSLVPPENILRADAARNLLILAGTQIELARIQETIDIFDVDWLSGMSVAIYPVTSSDPATVAGELDQLIGPGADTPTSGMIRFIPFDRLSSVMVVTQQPEYLHHAKVWLERLDTGGGSTSSDQKLYVYQVQFGQSDHLASLLQDVFNTSGGSSSSTTRPARTAPNRTQTTVSNEGTTGRNESRNQAENQRQATQRRNNNNRRNDQDQAKTNGLDGDNTRIISDPENNALLIMSSPRDYRIIEATLKRLDVPRRQVLIEATIAEVTLSGNLEYGLQWFFENNGLNIFNSDFTGTGSVAGTGESFDIGGTTPLILGQGFNYSLTDPSGTVRAALKALANDSKVRILSAPHLMVLDNETGSIRVGNEQPIFTSTTQNLDPNNNTSSTISTNQIQYRDTGVTLDVTPYINAGGQITLELTQDVTDVGEVDSATQQRSFLQRTIESVISVQSGESVVLGGLIRDNQTTGKGGVPGLYKLPIIGSLFGTTTNSGTRTELVVLITPRIVRNNDEARLVKNEIRQRMRSAFEFYDDELNSTAPKTKPAEQ